VTAADRPYGKFYDFYSVSLETFGSTHVCYLHVQGRKMEAAVLPKDGTFKETKHYHILKDSTYTKILP
jgi:hypothetical protein